jgi:hypothetical protein
MPLPLRTVHCAEALGFLRDQPLPEGSAILTSLPDASELRSWTFARWQEWFVQAAEQVVRATPPRSAAIFYQTDVKRDGAWVDKSYLVQQGAYAAGARLLWHKVVCRAPAGRTTYARPGYAHLLCFSRDLVDPVEQGTPDVLPELGPMTWPRAIGLHAAHAAVTWLRDHAGAHCIVDPFCGVGTTLAVANHHQLAAIGIELAPGRAQKARELHL